MIIGAAWLKETKKGEKFFSCVIDVPFLGKMNFSIFKCKEKTGKSPDYQIVWNSQSRGDAGKKEVNPFSEAQAGCPF